MLSEDRSTPLDLIGSATLIFSIRDTNTGIDPETGNPIFTYIPWQGRAKLDQQRDAPRDVERRDRPAIWVAGYMTDPYQLPPAIRSIGFCEANINGQSGKLYLVPVLQKAALVSLDLLDVSGEKIQGWFEI
jgi:hypothetical protein